MDNRAQIKAKLWEQVKQIVDGLTIDEVERFDVVIRDYAESTMDITIDIEVKRTHKE